MPTLLAPRKGRQKDQKFKGHPQVHSEFEASLGYMRPCFRNKKRGRAEMMTVSGQWFELVCY